MRKIKFRAWDKEDGRWASEDWELYIDLDGKLWGRFNDGKWTEVSHLFEIMQYTGLTDKNGKEIYEGDIIKYQGCFSFDYDDKDEMIEEVKFVNGAFTPIYLSERELHSYDDELMIVEDIEVIGNIYENKELIKS